MIDAVRTVTHIAPPDANGKIIGEDVVQEGVIAIPSPRLIGLCAGATDARTITFTQLEWRGAPGQIPDTFVPNPDGTAWVPPADATESATRGAPTAAATGNGTQPGKGKGKGSGKGTDSAAGRGGKGRGRSPGRGKGAGRGLARGRAGRTAE